MAKKKEEKPNLNIDDILIKEFGDVIANTEYIRGLNNKIIPTTPKLDLLLGGGISEGTLTIIAAAPKFGKTTLVLQIAKNALEIDTEHGPREVYYLNIESRIKERDLYGIKGLDYSRIKIITSKPGNIISGDDFLKIGEKILNSKSGAVIIFDSFSALCSQERMESDLSERFRDNMPATLGSFCRRIAPVISINKSIVLGINHMYANTSGKGNKTWLEGSGQKLQYTHDTKILGTFTQPWIEGDVQIGLKTNWKIPTTYLPGALGGETTTFLKFGEGYSIIQEYIDIAIDIGIIKKGGSWYEFKGEKYQGEARLRFMLENDNKKFKELKEQVNSLFKK